MNFRERWRYRLTRWLCALGWHNLPKEWKERADYMCRDCCIIIANKDYKYKKINI